MKINKKILIILLFTICIVSLLFGSVAYYRFLVSGNINGSTGNAVFNVTGFKDDSSSIKTIELGKISPGDSGEFTITLDASGSTVDMYATLTIDRGDSSNNTELPTNLKFYTTSDHKSELHKYYSFLEKSGTNKETLTIYWYWNPFISDEDDNKYINREFSANIEVNAIQISEYAMMKNGYSGTEFWNNTYKPYIRTIMFGNDLSNKPESCTGNSDLCWDVSYDASQKKKVYAYLVDSGLKDSTDSTKTLYNLYIVSEAPIFAPTSCFSLFANFKKLLTIDFNNNFNTSKTTNMEKMFNVCSVLTTIDLSNFNTSNVTTMNYMYASCSALTILELDNFNTSNVINMDTMFSNCQSIIEINLSMFNTSKVTNMSDMFSYCSSLTVLWLNSFNTSNVTDMSGMFFQCSSLTNMDLSNFNTSKVTNMDSIFYKCSSLTNLNLSSFNTSNVTRMSDMFNGCKSLEKIDLSNFNTSKVTIMSSMFMNCSSLINLDLSNFNTSNVTDMSYMFSVCSSLTKLSISNFDTSNVTDMTWLFYSCNKIQTEFKIMNANVSYSGILGGYMSSGVSHWALSDEKAYIIINYVEEAKTLAEAIVNSTYSSNRSKITLKQI